MSDTNPTATDRLLEAFRALVRAELPHLSYLGVWEYSVQATNGDTVDAVPLTDAAAHLPALVGVQLWPSILGEQVTPVVGSTCLVAFVNGDPTRPMVIGGDPANPAAHAKITGGGPAAARVGDAATIYVGVASILGVPTFLLGDALGPRWGVTATALAASPLTPGLLWGVGYPAAFPINGQITSGSAKTEIG